MIKILFTFVVLLSFAACKDSANIESAKKARQTVSPAAATQAKVVPQISEPQEIEFIDIVVKPGDSFEKIFTEQIPYLQAREIIKAIDKKKSITTLLPGDKVVFYKTNHNQEKLGDLTDATLQQEIVRIDWIYSISNRIMVTQKPVKLRPHDATNLSNGNDNEVHWEAKKVETPYEVSFEYREGEIDESLWNSAKNEGISDRHIVGFADLFVWDLDFSREVKKGDSWKMLIEKRIYQGKRPVLGKILVAEYKRATETFKAVRWEGNDKIGAGYYKPNGDSLRRVFLKSPIDYARISSKFSKARFHPILKINRPHLGVDYAAASGTPVKTIGDGVVVYKGYSNTAGNTLKIRHNRTYTTAYKHLKKFSPKIKKGVKVVQGQVIGQVGTTGLSTGPHLHFELKKNGRITDPLSEVFPSAGPIPEDLLAAFREDTKVYNELFESKNPQDYALNSD